MFAWFPLIGAVMGSALVISEWILNELELVGSSFIVLVIWVVLTGGLHLDGLADSCDGLFATVDPSKRLEVMKDPRCGAYAVIGVCLALLGKLEALQSLNNAFPVLLILPPVLGRWSMVLLAARWRTSVRSDSYAAVLSTGFRFHHILVATASTLLITGGVATFYSRTLSSVTWAFVFSIGIVPLLVWGIASIASRRLGGLITGDIFGLICEITELVTLWLLVSVGFH